MKAIVTGSFDPITIGHMEIIKRASEKYDKVYVVALVNEAKNYMFSLEQKKRFIELSVRNLKNVIPDAYAGWTADYMHIHGITHIVRGVRNAQDMIYEKDLAEKMKAFDVNFETEIMECQDCLSDVSSTIVRKKIENGESIKGLVPDEVLKEINNL